MSKPAVSVAMCTYQAERFLCDQLFSICNQTEPPVELVICDDGSTDDTLRILEAFDLSNIESVRVYGSRQNLGTTKNFERAVGHCTGDHIFFCDADDVWYPKKLELESAVLAALPRPGIVLCDADIVDESLKPSSRTLWNSEVLVFTSEQRKRFRSEEAVRVILELTITFGSTMGFNAEFKDIILPIPLGCGPDTWTGILVSALADTALVEMPLMAYRQHNLQHVGATTRGIRGRLSRKESLLYPELIQSYLEATHRLQPFAGKSESVAVALDALREKGAHLEARSRVVNGEHRARNCVGQLRCGNYSRYSSGWRSAAKDMLLGIPNRRSRS